MPTSPFPYPDLPLDICGEIFNAVGRELRAITLLEPVVGNRIRACESIRAALSANAVTTEAPAIFYALGPQLEIRTANGGQSRLTTAVDIILFTKCSDPFDPQDCLRQRIFHQVKLRLVREQGTLRSGDGEEPESGPDNRITNAMKGFGQIDPTGPLESATNLFVTTFRVTFESDIDEATRQFIG